MSSNYVKRILQNVVDTGAQTAVLYPLWTTTDTEVAGTTVTAGAAARVYNPTAAAGYTNLITTGSETADFTIPAVYYDTCSALGIYFFKFGRGVAISEVVLERIKVHLNFAAATATGDHANLPLMTRPRFSVAANNRFSVACASIAGGSETILQHTVVLRGN